MSFAFLAHPPSLSQLNSKSTTRLTTARSSILPPPKPAKRRDSGAADSPRRPSIRRRSATVSGTVCTITAWASSIVPGSPAPLTPRSPRTPPLSALSARFRSASSPHVVQHSKRRASSVSFSPATGGFNFLSLVDTPSTAHARISLCCTPSPSHLENKPTEPSVGLDLLAQGYTTVFVRLPGTPVTPHTAPLQFTTSSRAIPNASASEQPGKLPPVPAIPATPKTPSAKRAFTTRLRSLSFKAPSKKSMISSTSSKHPSAAMSKQKQRNKSAASSSTPQTRYGHLLAPAGGAGALPLSQEVQLSQMLDGGSTDANIKRVTKRHAKETGALASSKNDKSREDAPGDGVSGVYRDGRGGMYWDEDEAFELANLLKRPPTSPASPRDQPQPKKSALGLGLLKVPAKVKKDAQPSLPADWVDPSRRGSESAASDVSTTRSSSASELGFVVRPLSGTGALTSASGTFVPGYRVGMGAVSSLRPRDAFSVPPNSTPEESVSTLESTLATGATARQRPRARHRPAPLTLASSLPAPVCPPPMPTMKSASEVPQRSTAAVAAIPALPAVPSLPVRANEVEEGRKDFFASSFDPPVPTAKRDDDEKEQQRPGLKSGRRMSFNMGLGSMINSTARTVRRASASLGVVPSPGPLTAVTSKVNNSSAVHVNSAANSSSHLQSLAYGQGSTTTSRTSSSKTLASAPLAPTPLRTKSSKLKLSSFFHRDKSTKV